MIRFSAMLVGCLIGLIFLWHECGEDVGVFCYRIGSGAFSGLRSRALAPARNSYSAARADVECLIPSATLSTYFSTLRDSRS